MPDRARHPQPKEVIASALAASQVRTTLGASDITLGRVGVEIGRSAVKTCDMTKHPSPGAKAALLRSGSGTHGDRRTKRQRTRAAVKARAFKEAS